jgi:glyoxylase-like metal-dependent hydrolase (beta-lactamase superfamily II)
LTEIGGTIRRRLLLNAGSVRAPEFVVTPGGGLRYSWQPCLFALVEHAREGIGLFDTGHAHRFFEATREWPYSIYRRITRVRMAPEEDAVRQLAALGISAPDVRWIVISHFDPDHIGGLRDFPAARIICLKSAYHAIAGKRGMAALRARLLPNLLPDDMERRLMLLPEIEGAPIGPFTSSLDLFGDGGIRLVDLPGHAEGQVGAFLRAEDGADWFLAADGCWNRATISPEARHTPPVNLHRAIAVNRRLQDQTYEHLRQLGRSLPRVVLIPSHCPEAAASLVSQNIGRTEP